MRIAVILAALLLAACASDKLALAPPTGVDFTGNWKLNEADSDDPLRLTESQTAAAAANSQTGGGPGGRGGRRGGPASGMAGPIGPATPSIGVLGAGLRWPGKELQIKQIAGVVAFTSEGRNVVFQPAEAQKARRRLGGPTGSDDMPQGRDAPRGRDLPPPVCGWEGKTLVVRSTDPDDDQPPYDQRYSVSADGRRLVEVVGFKGGRSSGFTMSRVWDRVP